MFIRCAIALIAPWLLSGCFSYPAASSGAVGCPTRDIEIREAQLTLGGSGPVRNWTAICHEHEYLCSSVGTGSAACSRVASEDQASSAAARSQHWVKRGFEEAQATPTVTAHLRLGVRQSLDLSARPTTLEDVAVRVIMLKQRGVACTEMRWTLNAIPQSTMPVRVHDLGPTYRLEGTLPRAVVAELQRPRPSLRMEACGQTVSLDAGALAALSEFADVYSDIAMGAATPLPAPTQLTCESPAPSELLVRWQNPGSGAGSVELEYAEQQAMPAGQNRSVMDLPTSESLLVGLVPGTPYAVRVRLRRADEYGAWAETVCRTRDAESPAHGARASGRFNTTLRAVCAVSTRKGCSQDDPCCNTCLAVRWESIAPELRVSPSGAPYRFVGEPLPQCRGAKGQCGCDFELRVEAEVVGTDLVVHELEQVPAANH